MAVVEGARVTIIGSACTPGQLNQSGIGEPETYATALQDPTSFTGLGRSWDLPWGSAEQPVAPDHFFWESWVDRSTRFPAELRDGFVRKLLNRGIPLRCRVDATIAPSDGACQAGTPTAELFLHPWAVHSALSADLTWAAPVGLEQAADDVDTWLSTAAATMWPAAAAASNPVLDVPQSAALAAADQLGGSDAQPGWPSAVVVATVTKGDPGTPLPLSFFPPHSELHRALHKLAHGPIALAEPPAALLPVDDGLGGTFDPTQIRYLLRFGMSQWLGSQLSAMPARIEDRIGSQHRFSALGIVQVRGCHALTHIWAASHPGGWVPAAHKGVVQSIRRWYGPHRLRDGFVIQRYCDATMLAEALTTDEGPPERKYNPVFPT